MTPINNASQINKMLYKNGGSNETENDGCGQSSISSYIGGFLQNKPGQEQANGRTQRTQIEEKIE
jgi:hypothetical protein